MKIADILRNNRPTFSFEFFPPRDDAGFEMLYHTIEALKPIRPTFVSVTYGAGGSTRRKTVELVAKIRNEIGLEAMAHLTCVGHTRSEIDDILRDLRDSGIENVLALRGDPPQGQDRFVPQPGGFAHANELVEFIRQRYDFCIGVAGYPEGHPEAPSKADDLMNLKRKVDAGADFIITQLFFDNDDFYRFRSTAEWMGIDVPIIAGIMPILSLKQIRRFTQMCGASIPAPLLGALEALEDDPEAVRHLGMFHATSQCQDLLTHDVAGIHFYTLNRSTATRAICHVLRAGLAARRPAASRNAAPPARQDPLP